METNNCDNVIIVVTGAKLVVSGSSVNEIIGGPVSLQYGKKSNISALDLLEAGISTHGLDDTQERRNTGQITVPISSINQYIKNWTIRGRVTHKSTIRTWNNSNGSGKLFTFNLTDESCDIKITAFRGDCDKYFDIVHFGKIYFVGNCNVKESNKKYSDTKHDFELVLHPGSIIKLDNNNDTGCPKIQFDFVKISNLQNMDLESVVDVIGVCKNAGNLATVSSTKFGKDLKKRDISLVDDSKMEINFTLWNKDAENFNGETGSIVIVKKARLSNYGGRSLTTIASTVVDVDPKNSEADELTKWFVTAGRQLKSESLTTAFGRNSDTTLHNLDAITRSNVAISANSMLILNCIATVIQIGKTVSYMSCLGSCKKKLIELEDGYYRCGKCNKKIIKGEDRIIIKLCIADSTKSVWVSAFTEEAEKLIGMSINEIISATSNEESKIDSIVETILFKKYQFRIRCTLENFNPEIKSNIISVTPINPIAHMHNMLDSINKLIEQ
ncbi:replication protein A 70 kDa DNA-binding subunit-like [Tetranychus urticae]|uniref:Replication protein A subunit n=2 Tax=Tetranychus urticae TaxID=32264 RepID=T1K1T1_TETUR|nr:replication protein A 70 kDa DNA-binding subunit-like [Tetranychus urticae]